MLEAKAEFLGGTRHLRISRRCAWEKAWGTRAWTRFRTSWRNNARSSSGQPLNWCFSQVLTFSWVRSSWCRVSTEFTVRHATVETRTNAKMLTAKSSMINLWPDFYSTNDSPRAAVVCCMLSIPLPECPEILLIWHFKDRSLRAFK